MVKKNRSVAHVLPRLAIGGMYLVAWLPWWTYRPLAAALVMLGFALAPTKVRIAAVNLRLCFPDLSRARRWLALVRCLNENALWLLTTSRVWLRPHTLAHIEKRCEIIGAEHVHSALEAGVPTILCAAHQPHVDVSMVVLTRTLPFCPTYRPYRSTLFNRFMVEKRQQLATALVSIKDLRAVAKACKQHKVLWIAPDQDPGRRASVFVPFLGVQAAHGPGVRRLADICRAQVCPLTLERTHGWCWRITIHPPLKDFPSADISRDTLVQNHPLEQSLRAYPHNYLWLHRRFKTQPEGAPSPYARS